MDYKALAERLVQLARAKGADAAEVYLQGGRDLSIDVRNGEIETVEESSSAGAGFRVFVKGRMAFSSSNDLRDSALDAAVARAIEFARSTTSDPNNVLPTETGTTPIEGLYDAAIATTPMERKIELAKTVERLALKDPRITKSAGATYGDADREVVLANSNGLLKTYRHSSCWLGVSLVCEKGDQKTSGGETCTRRFFADVKPPAEIAARAIERATELLDPRPVRTQRAAVIFRPEVGPSLLGGILGATNGEAVLQGASFLGTRLNQRIASELVTLIDDPTRPRGLGSKPFDGEGVPTRRRVIVEKGLLKEFFYNTIVAGRAGVKTTGNASRAGFTSLPGIGAHGFVMAPGETTPADVIKATKVGLLLTGVTGYGINAVNGNFSGGAEGLWIENGAIAFPVKGLTIAGTAAEMLTGVDLVGTDLDLGRATATPTFRIASMQIGGE
jgi:PmbA protein